MTNPSRDNPLRHESEQNKNNICPDMERQLNLEAEMMGMGADRYSSRIRKDIEAGRGANTPSGSFLVKTVIQPLSAAIDAFISEAYSGKPGPKAQAAVSLRSMDSQVVAFLTARSVISQVLHRRSSPTIFSAMAEAVAKAVEAEARFEAFKEQNPALLEAVKRKLSDDGANEAHKTLVLNYAMGKFNIKFDRWPRTILIQVGSKLIDLFRESTGLIELERVLLQTGNKGLQKDQWQVSLSPKAVEWLEQSVDRGRNLFPYYLPTVIPPKPWDSLEGGGYHSNLFTSPIQLVRGSGKQHRGALGKAHLGTIYGALNAVQETPWAVNKDTLEVFEAYVRSGGNGPSMVSTSDTPLPPKPDDIAHNPEALQQWKWAARDVHRANVLNRAERLNQHTLLDIAKKFKDEEVIYFPHNLDFRGRFYPIPLVLQPQGSDLVKSLLRFGVGKPLGDEGKSWWMIHGANTYGIDKVSFRERKEWIKEHSSEMIKCATDPFSNSFWKDADKPWQFLAFCFEWSRYHEDPEGFVSYIPIALDGSCNGLQHFSALLRDPIGGAATNLIQSPLPADIYQTVADRVKQKLSSIHPDIGEDKKRWAYEWSLFPIDRKITKRPVMVLPYGGTPRSCMKYVREAVMEKIDKGVTHNFGDELPQAIAFLSSLVWESIGDVVVAAREAMGWLQKVARLLAKSNDPIYWTTPSGFVCYQRYVDMKPRLVKTQVAGSIIRLRADDETDKINRSKQATSISPNFVHSMDAAAMALTVVELKAQGVNSFAMIHDSYGSHACDTQLLAYELRKAFVEMYHTDPLTHFLEDIKKLIPETRRRTDKNLPSQKDIPELPRSGSLDIEGIMDSQFFFA